MKFYPHLLLLVGILTPWTLHAIKPMSDEEVRDLIVQGSIKDYEEGTNCPNDFQVRKREPIRTTEGSVSESTTSENPFVCECACPYSKDIKGNKCGQNSAYFSGLTKCYREDVKDYEVSDFRSENGIPDPNKPHPESR